MATSLKETVATVKAAYVISDYIKQAGVKLTPSGPGKWKGLCSFHQEKTASFTVSDDFQNYHCWGCGASGDLLKWVMETEQLEFMEAIKKLAEEKGIQLELTKSDEPTIDYRSLRECLKETANFFVREYRKLPENHAARQEVTRRGLSEKGMIYGYAPENRTALCTYLKSKNFTDEVILQAGVATKWEDSGKVSDFWSGRLMFVITDVTGKPIGFSGRKLFEGDKRGKFVNSPAGPLFDKSSALFNIQNAKASAAAGNTIYVAEGQFDVAAFMEAGIPHAVASSGTAFTQQQASILQRLVGESGKVVFAFDGDEAGVSAALKVFKNIPSLHSTAFVVQFPKAQDPCDYRQHEGNEKFKSLLTSAIPLVTFVLETSKSNFDLTSDLGRAQYLDYAAQVLATISSSSLRSICIRKVALDTFTEVAVVQELMKKSKPLELGSAGEAQTQEKHVPTELEEKPQISLVELVNESELYSIAARVLALAILERSLVPPLVQHKERLPKEFQGFIEELAAYDATKPLIPEAFEDSDFLRYLTNSELFPHANLAGFDSKAQFSYVFKRFVTMKREKRTKAVHGRIHSILASAQPNDVALLADALASEDKFLKETSNAPKIIPDRDEPERASEGDKG